MKPGSIEYEMQFPPELRDPSVMDGGRRGASIPRILAPGIAASTTYWIPEGVDINPEEISALETDLDTIARFNKPDVQPFIDMLSINPEIEPEEPPEGKMLFFRPKQ